MSTQTMGRSVPWSHSTIWLCCIWRLPHSPIHWQDCHCDMLSGSAGLPSLHILKFGLSQEIRDSIVRETHKQHWALFFLWKSTVSSDSILFSVWWLKMHLFLSTVSWAQSQIPSDQTMSPTKSTTPTGKTLPSGCLYLQHPPQFLIPLI